MMSTQRAKNTASQSEIGRILRAHLDVEVIESWLKDRVFQPEQVAKSFVSALVEVLSWTPRLNKSTLSPAFSEIFRLSQADANALSQAWVDCVTHCRQVRKSISSGAKTPAEVKRIIQVLSGATTAAPAAISATRSSSISPPAKLGKDGGKKRSASPETLDISSGEEPASSSSKRTPTEAALKASARSFGICVSSPVKVCGHWVDWSATQVKRSGADGVEIADKLEYGDQGFVVACFGQDRIPTVMPNLFLRMAKTGDRSASNKKRPAAVMKRPSKACKPACSPDADAVAVSECDEEHAAEAPDPGPPPAALVDVSSALTVVAVSKTAATAQSYVQAKLSDGKKKLLVSIPKSMSEAHQDKIKVLHELAQAKYAELDFDALKHLLLARRAEII